MAEAGARLPRRQADDRPRGRGRARRRQRDQVRGADGHARDPLGGRAGADRLDRPPSEDLPGRRPARARATLPPRVRADNGRQLRPLGRNLGAIRRRDVRVARRRAVAGSIAARRRVAARRGRAGDAIRRVARRARAPAAERGRLLPARRSGARAARSAQGSAGAALDVACLARRAARRRRDPRHLEAGGPHRARSRPGRVSRAERATRSRRRPPPCRFRASTGRSKWSGKPDPEPRPDRARYARAHAWAFAVRRHRTLGDAPARDPGPDRRPLPVRRGRRADVHPDEPSRDGTPRSGFSRTRSFSTTSSSATRISSRAGSPAPRRAARSRPARCSRSGSTTRSSRPSFRSRWLIGSARTVSS